MIFTDTHAHVYSSEFLNETEDCFKRTLVNDVKRVFVPNVDIESITPLKAVCTAYKENYFPSPAIFVYTLPNICLGEISIKHQLKSENSFFIFEEFNSEFTVNYADILLNTKKADQVLCGWVDYLKDDYKDDLGMEKL